MEDPIVAPVVHMSKIFGGATIVKKGMVDIITDGNEAFYVATPGSLKRPGGIGDLLAGAIGAFSQFSEGYRGSDELKSGNKMLPACVGASLMVRQASKQAYERKRHSMVTPDIFEEMCSVMFI